MLQEKIRVALYVQKAALTFIDGTISLQALYRLVNCGSNNILIGIWFVLPTAVSNIEYQLPEEARKAGFFINSDELATIAREHNSKSLKVHGGIDGISRKLSVSLEDGIKTSDLSVRQNIFGANKFPEKPARRFWMFVWDALQDLTLIIMIGLCRCFHRSWARH